jgi:hypothetical protein
MMIATAAVMIATAVVMTASAVLMIAIAVIIIATEAVMVATVVAMVAIVVVMMFVTAGEARATLLDSRYKSLSIRCIRRVFDWIIGFLYRFLFDSLSITFDNPFLRSGRLFNKKRNKIKLSTQKPVQYIESKVFYNGYITE